MATVTKLLFCQVTVTQLFLHSNLPTTEERVCKNPGGGHGPLAHAHNYKYEHKRRMAKNGELSKTFFFNIK